MIFRYYEDRSIKRYGNRDLFHIAVSHKYQQRACGTKSGQILLNCVTDAIIVNIYIKCRLKLIENELGHTFELNVTF